MKLKINSDVARGRIYAGATLPEGSILLGMVIRDDIESGALVRLANGYPVQINAGVIRSLPLTRAFLANVAEIGG